MKFSVKTFVRTIVFAFCISSLTTLQAQDPVAPSTKCATERLTPDQMKDPVWKSNYDKHNEAISRSVESHQTSRSSWPKKTVPILFVVLNDGKGNIGLIDETIIMKQLDLLNKQMDYNQAGPVDFHFCLATEVAGNPMTEYNSLVPENSTIVDGSYTITVGQIDQGTVPGIPNPGIFFIDVNKNFAWHGPGFPEYTPMAQICTLSAQEYLIVYIAHEPSGTSWSYLPGYSSPTVKPGILMHADMFGAPPCSHCTTGNDEGKTFTHEIGHYFGLYHTFHAGTCKGAAPYGDPGDGCNLFGDFCCDTDPRSALVGNCQLTDCSLSINYNNYMDYSNDPCKYLVTVDQTDRMHATISSYYSFLYSNANLSQTGCMNAWKNSPEETTSMENVIDSKAIKFYPTPADNVLNIENAMGMQVRILNLLGQEQLLSNSIPSTNFQLDVEFLELGVYVIQFENENGQVVYQDRMVVK